jgi:hypothetical protein
MAWTATPELSPSAMGAMPQSSQWTPPRPSSLGEVAAQICVAAPCSGVLNVVSVSLPYLSIHPAAIISSFARWR